MLVLMRESCGHCSNKKWYKAEKIAKQPEVWQYICLYCGYCFWV